MGFITDNALFVNLTPWTCFTGGNCSPAPVESQVGGDTLCLLDADLVNNVLGSSGGGWLYYYLFHLIDETGMYGLCFSSPYIPV